MRASGLRLVIFSALAVTGAAAAIAPAPAATPPPAAAPGERGIAYSIQLQATIDPATQRWISSALDDARSEGAKLVIIRLDTPGGLSDSMRSIIQDMLAAPMPVVVYVSPNGARAGSAGAYTNDAAAYVRALARGHGRNPDLAEEMVRKATNVTARRALHAGLIDLIAPTEQALLGRLDGFRVKGPKAQVLHTAGLTIERHDMPLQYDLLEILVNPTVSYLLLLAGLLGLAIELFSPGAIAPGALGALSFLLGLYGTAQLPVTVAGVLLLVFGLAMIVAEAHLPTHGILGASGVAALVASGLLLYDTKSSAFEVSAPVVVIAGLLLGGFLAVAVERAIRARGQPVRTGWEEMVGAVGEGRDRLDPVGQIFVEGALWRAVLAGDRASDGRALERGSRVRVESVEGLTLRVRPLEAADPESQREA